MPTKIFKNLYFSKKIVFWDFLNRNNQFIPILSDFDEI
jgi:hypothetical protein